MHMTVRHLLLTAALLGLSAALPAAEKPNIIYILADDVGYGDLSCYGATRVNTPNLDRLAAQGLRFTDGHAPSATCTPTRYATITGQYAWRKKGTAILPGDAALIFEPGSLTLPALMKQAGYTTGVVGKWHLGLGTAEQKVDWNTEIKPGPLEIGFDYSFLIPATGDRTPCVFVENHRVVGLDPADPISVRYGEKIGDEPTGRENPDLLKMKPSHGHDMTIVNGISRIGYMTGGKAARWVDEDIADTITRKATAFVEQNKEKPFFLYFPTHDIHVPRVPHPRFVGKTEMGARGDAIVQLDWCVGEVLATLERLKLTENTLIIFSSDNGPVVDDGYQDEAVAKLGNHSPSGPLRGGKYSNFEGGTRVPFIVRWPDRIKPGTSDALVCQIDLMASFAALTGQSLPTEVAPDSLNMLPALLGESKTGREYLVEHASQLSLRHGTWKYIPPGKGPKRQQNTGVESGKDEKGQLFDLSRDLGEKMNVLSEHPDKAAAMAAKLEEIQKSGRSRN